MSRGLVNQVLATVFGNLATISYAVSSGWVSPNLRLLQSDLTPLESGPLNDDELSWISSIMRFGGLVGTLMFGWLSDRIGRKKCLILNAFPSAIGWIIIAFGSNFYLLAFARFLCGIGGGGILAVLPVYISEISQDNKRGLLSSCIAINQNIGILYGFICGSYMPYRIAPLITSIFPIVSGIAYLFFPETPRYLLSIKQKEAARESLHFFRKNSDFASFSEEYDRLVINIDKQMSTTTKLLWSDFTSKAAVKALIISFVLISMRQLNGAFPIINYASLFFTESKTSLSSKISCIILGIFQLIGSIIACILVDRAGRKFLLLLSSIGASISLICAGIYFYLKGHDFDVSKYDLAPLICLSGVVFFAACGLIALVYVIIVEICSQKIRGTVTMSMTIYSWILLFVLIHFFISMSNVIGLYGIFWLFAACCICMIFFVIFFIPETKGKGISVILDILGK